jgi:hypothetical protein
MASSRKKGKTIHSEAREMLNRVTHLCKQEAVEKSLILPICCADERPANHCGVSVATVKQIRWESRERNYAELKPYIFKRSISPPQQRPPALPRSKLFSWVTDSIFQRFGGTYSHHLQGWRWRQHVSPKRWYLHSSPKGVTTQETNIDIFTAVRTSDLM